MNLAQAIDLSRIRATPARPTQRDPAASAPPTITTHTLRDEPEPSSTRPPPKMPGGGRPPRGMTLAILRLLDKEAVGLRCPVVASRVGYGVNAVSATLGSMHRKGWLTRSGKVMRFAWALSASGRSRLRDFEAHSR